MDLGYDNDSFICHEIGLQGIKLAGPIANNNNKSGTVLSSQTVSILDDIILYNIDNAVIVMIGINSGSLEGIAADYENMIKLFVNDWNFQFIYQTCENEMVYLTKKRFRRYYHRNFKIEWNSEEISQFTRNSKKMIEIIKPDSLIFIISSEGESDDVLIDSEGEEYQLLTIMRQFWNEKTVGCPFLADKPKLFVFDMCCGQK